MSYLLYLMFRCDGKFEKLGRVGGTKHSLGSRDRTREQNFLQGTRPSSSEDTSEELHTSGPEEDNGHPNIPFSILQPCLFLFKEKTVSLSDAYPLLRLKNLL